ncbi:MAG: hypothetical protein K2X47_13175 [Bdellovibrionales bacterium]|nr:hypothetical protein [Bdellovibrionales bacterium]
MTRAFDDLIEATGIVLILLAAALSVCLVVPSFRQELVSYVRTVRHEMKLAKFSPAKIRSTCAKLTQSNDLYSECYMPIIQSTFQKEEVSAKTLGPAIQLGRMTLKSEHALFDAQAQKAEVLGRRLKEVHLLLSGLHWSHSLSRPPTETELAVASAVKKELLVSYVRTSQGLRADIRAELQGLGRSGRELVRRLNDYDRNFVRLARQATVAARH